MMPLSPLWACLFFMMLIFLGLDSQVTMWPVVSSEREACGFHVLMWFCSVSVVQFVCVESLVTAVVDMYPDTFRRGYRRELLILGMSITSFLIGLIMCTEVRKQLLPPWPPSSQSISSQTWQNWPVFQGLEGRQARTLKCSSSNTWSRSEILVQ